EGVVSTSSVEDFKTFIAQRRRWGGKWRLHKAVGVKLLAVFVFAFHVTLIIAFVKMLLDSFDPWVFAGVFFVKACFEFFFLKRVLQHVGKSLSMKHFVFLQAVYSLYVTAFGILVNFGAFEWKGRKYGKND